jgi:ABC-type transport system involved in multi-copper enzyme maturation permease subunit
MSWAPTVAVNPVLERELRQRLRGRSAWTVLTVYLAVLAVILRIVYGAVSHSTGAAPLSQAQSASAAGRSIFHWLLFFMLGLVCFIVPGMTSAAIAGERERQTLVPLQVTLLSARSIVVGKLLASLAFVVLLVLAALPLLSVPFLLGGVDAAEVLHGVAMLLAVAVVLACTSLACSSTLRRTQLATVTAYGIVAALVVGTPLVYAAQRALDHRVTGTSKPTVLVVNPFAAVAEVVKGRTATESLSSPFTGIQGVLEDEVFVTGGGSAVSVVPRSVGGVQAGPPVTVVQGPVPPVPTTFAGNPSAVLLTPNPIATGPGPPPPPPPGVITSSGSGLVVSNGPGFASSSFQVGGVPNGFGPGPQRRPTVAGMPFWVASLVSYVAIAALALLVAVWGVRAPAGGRAE